MKFTHTSCRPRAMLCLAFVTLTGCASTAQQQSLSSLREDIAKLDTALAQQAETREARIVSSVSSEISSVSQHLAQLSEQVTTHCQTQILPTCEASAQPVVMQTDKLIVGQVENVWLDPPGLRLTARIDTGAQSSSLHASELVEFERDGADWVRFTVNHSGESVSVERPVEKYVRVFQQSDKQGSRRPVVKMRIFLGNIKETFAFTLADRAHLQHGMILGRNFLTDMALVDVAQEFIQPKFQPPKT